MSLQQGTADLDSPTVNAGGGLITLDLQDPQDKAGGLVSGSFGSYHEGRAFVRLDSGIIPGTDVRAFVSFSQTAADNYRGPGDDHRQHIDFKLIDAWGDGNHIALAGSYHDAIPQLVSDADARGVSGPMAGPITMMRCSRHSIRITGNSTQQTLA